MLSSGKFFISPVGMLLLLLFLSAKEFLVASAQGTEGFFNGSSYVFIYNTFNINGRTSFSFRTCSSGQLLRQDGAGADFIELALLDYGVFQLKWQYGNNETSVFLGNNLNDNRWHDVDLIHSLGTVTLNVDSTVAVVANSSYRNDLFDVRLDGPSPTIIVGSGYKGCLLQGAGVVLNTTSISSRGVVWGKCPLPDRGDCVGYEEDHCFSQPCHKYSRCISLPDTYFCDCSARYMGRNCETDLGPLCDKLEFNQCLNEGVCREDMIRNSTSCVCSPTFTGSFCENRIENTFCVTQPCRNGGICNINQNRDNYVCSCPQGFAGMNCELNVDECQTFPCKNNGTCTDEINSYTCDCTGTGYRGPNCEININECVEENPCYTGSRCFDRYGDYICDCPHGFGGKNCDQEVDECDSNPCQNGGECVDHLNNYLCHCIQGFAGVNCEINIDDCLHSSCPNNTHCVDGINTFSCVCNPGYSGAVPHCVEIDECASNPCHNGGTCIDQLSNYMCECARGFNGRFCEINVNECLSDPCKAGSTCVDGIGQYTCTCIPGFTGINCDTDINECEPNPCQNSVRCQNMANDYHCECFPGWEGKNCDVNTDECSPNPCLHGQCVDLLNNFTCACNPGYIGRACEENINECDSSPCLNNAVCIDMVADFSCQCPQEFMGKNCSQIYDACHSTPCKNNGSCRTTVPSRDYTCTCRPGYTGSQCEIDINECEGITCPFGQICFDLENRYECGCPIGYTGSTCSININECSSNPCMNGSCVDGIGNYTCVCRPGFTGRHCENDIDECEPSPCINGICKNFPGTFLCYCRPGFTGTTCDIEFNECLSSPCRNNATCNDLVNDYSCTCVPGFSGHNCEENIDECASNPCQNGGTCTDKINKFECLCLPGFSGTSCEINIDECASSPCHNGGVCIDLINSFECNCTDSGFSGLYCETNIDDCNPSPCENGATCADKIKDHSCMCHDGYEGKNCDIDVPECSSSPCLNSGLCLENSNKTLYEINYLGFFPSFSYESAGGYRCICSSGFMGIDCETNIDDCEVNACSSHGECIDGINDYYCACLPGFEGQYCADEINECLRLTPCQNGASCEDLVADYTCHCAEGFGDKDCSTLLVGCHGNMCENNAECRPYLTPEGTHEHTCICPPGFHGDHCESVTTVSFKGNGSWALHQQGPLEKYVISLSFRTTLPDGVITQGVVPHSQLEYLLYLQDSRIELIVLNNGSTLTEIASPPGQNDSMWKMVKITFEDSMVALNTSGHMYIKSIPISMSAINFDTTIGSQRSLYSLLPLLPDFTGCIQDVYINGAIAIPDRQYQVMTEVELGCSREDQCVTSPCVHGHCKDNWTSYECICSRPYFGKHCEYSHNAATFGYKDKVSSAELLLPLNKQRELSNFVEVTFLLRTRKPNGLVFYLGSLPVDHILYSGSEMPSNNFLIAHLMDGKLQVLMKSDTSNLIEIILEKKLDDGDYHFIQITKDSNRIIVKANETSTYQTASTGPILSNVLYIADFPNVHRGKRQIGASQPLISYSFDNMTNFKGVIQDFRLNNMVVIFYQMDEVEDDPSSNTPLEIGKATMKEAMKGVVSDNLCDEMNPCARGATCNDIWNEYTCNCPKGYRGKNCDEEEPCNNNSCPDKSECRNLDVGYECVAAASFNGKNKSVHYRVHNMNPTVSNITFSFRSKSVGTILWLDNYGSFDSFRYFLQVELLNGSTSLEVKWDFNDPPVAIKTVSKEINNNGDWHRVEILFKDNVVELYVIPHSLLTSKEAKVPQLSEDNYLKPLGEVLRNGSSIFLGHSLEEDSLFKGCLKEVRIGGLLLPFFESPALPDVNSPFVIESNNVDIGCVLCWNDDCIHGQCSDPSDYYTCNCNGGYEGEKCEVDKCASQNPCANSGRCYHADEEIMCDCTYFYTGPNCTVENRCASSPCMNGGVCKHNLMTDDYECNCTEAYEGKNCERRKIVDCFSQPCKHGICQDRDISSVIKFICECYKGYEGETCDQVQDLCHSKPCGDNGNCSIKETSTHATYKCDCYHGFTGSNCETNINECDDKPCSHGDCIDGIGTYSCICYPGFEGLTCHERITSCFSGRNRQVCFNGSCQDTEDGYECNCDSGYFGKHCKVLDECESMKCNDRGICNPMHDLTERFFDFNCTCKDGYAGSACSEKLSISGGDNDDTSLILMILIPVMTLFILCLLIGAIVFLRMAKKKRATRGTYSPSRQEMFGSRVEMNHVMKPPPEERLI